MVTVHSQKPIKIEKSNIEEEIIIISICTWLKKQHIFGYLILAQNNPIHIAVKQMSNFLQDWDVKGSNSSDSTTFVISLLHQRGQVFA